MLCLVQASGIDKATGLPEWLLAVFVGFLVVVAVVPLPLIMWSAFRRLPWAICERLAHGKPFVTTRTSSTLGAWNPSKPLGRGNRTRNVPGKATYSMTADGMVAVEVVSNDGQRQRYVGPAVPRPEAHRRTSHLVGSALLVYIAMPMTGAVIGYSIDGPSRLGGAALGALIGLASMPILSPIVRALLKRRRSARALDATRR